MDKHIKSILFEDYSVIKNHYDKYYLQEYKKDLLKEYIKFFKKEKETKRAQNILYKIIKEDIFLDNEDVPYIKDLLNIFSSNYNIDYGLGRFLIFEIYNKDIIQVANYFDIFSKKDYNKIYQDIGVNLKEDFSKYLWICSNINFLSPYLLKKELENNKFLYKDNTKYSYLIIKNFYSTGKFLDKDKWFILLEDLDRRGFDFFKLNYFNKEYDVNLKVSPLEIVCDIQKENFKWFYSEKKNQKNQLFNRGILFWDMKSFREINSNIKVDKDTIMKIAHECVVSDDDDSFEKLVSIFNNPKFLFQRNKVLIELMSRYRIGEFVLKFLKNLNYDFILRKDNQLDLITVIMESYLIGLDFDDEESYWEDIIEICLDKKIIKLHFIEIINEVYLRDLQDTPGFKKKYNKIYDLWERSSDKESILNKKNFKKELFYPIVDSVDDNFLEKLIKSKRDDFLIKLFNCDKPKMQKIKKIILNKFDLKKIWIIYHCFKAKMNYDLIINYIEAENEPFVDELINLDLSKKLLFLKKYYTEKRIFSMLTKNFNLQHLCDVESLIELYEKKGMMSHILPKKPKKLDDIFINLVLTLKYSKDKNVKLKQEDLYPLDGVSILDCKVFIPKKHFDLVNCGAILGQCVGDGNFTLEINKNNSKIVILRKNNVDKYCIELDEFYKIKMTGSYKNNKVPSAYIKELKNIIKKLI